MLKNTVYSTKIKVFLSKTKKTSFLTNLLLLNKCLKSMPYKTTNILFNLKGINIVHFFGYFGKWSFLNYKKNIEC